MARSILTRLSLHGHILTVRVQLTITTREFLVADESTLVLTGNESIQATSLFVTNHSVITSKPQSHLGIDVPDLVIDQTSSISADRRGYPQKRARSQDQGGQ